MKKFIFFLLIVGIAFASSYSWAKNQNIVRNGQAQIFEGATVKEIAMILEESEVIPNGDVFYYYIKLKEVYYNKYKKTPNVFTVSFKHGDYLIESGNFDSLISQLNKGTNTGGQGVMVTIPEGKTIEQMATIFEDKHLFSKDSFLLYVNSKETYLNLKSTYAWLPEYNKDWRSPLEGILQANTYEFSIDSTPKTVVNKMLEQTHFWYLEYESMNNNNLTFFETLVLASIVERESKFKEDRPKVAQVFLNRLEKGMRLESDITAAYANNEHKVFMTYDDIDTISPYNTYVIDALPIGPIGAPSKDSYLGVLKPIGKDFKALYFYARPSGETFYANTWKEHDINRQKYEHEWLELNNK